MLEQQKNCKLSNEWVSRPAKICRFCLFKNVVCEERPLVHIFEDFNYEDVTEKIQNCLDIKLTPNDRIPPVICQSCMDKVNSFNNFLELSSTSEKHLEMCYGIEQSDSNTSQDINLIASSVNFISDQRIMTACKTESDYSINYHKPIKNEERKVSLLSRKRSINLHQCGKSSLMLMAQQKRPKEKQDECQFCRKKFTNVHEYQHHTKTAHKGETIYKCGKCQKIFLDHEKCIEHENNHKIECKLCNVQVSAKNMGKHLQKHAEKFKTKPAAVFKSPASGKHNEHVICEVCMKMFKSENRLTTHMQKMHETRKIRFSANRKYKSNNLKHTIRAKRLMKARSYKCKFCDNQFSTLKELQEHTMSSHNNSRNKCPNCRKQFLYKKHFVRHVVQCFQVPNQTTTLKRTSSLPVTTNTGLVQSE